MRFTSNQCHITQVDEVASPRYAIKATPKQIASPASPLYVVTSFKTQIKVNQEAIQIRYKFTGAIYAISIDTNR